MAAQAVLETFELLEIILLSLPMPDLLIFQRVSKTWHATISESKALQRALFFLPATDHCAIFRDDVGSSGTENRYSSSKWRVPDKYGTGYYFLCPSDLVRRLLYRTELVRDDAQPPEDLGPFKETEVYLNPLLLSHFPWSEWLFSSQTTTTTGPTLNTDGGYLALSSQAVRPDQIKNPHRYTSYDRVGMNRPEASWQRMLISQPPLGGLTTSVSRHEERNTIGDLWISKPLGGIDVRFAMLYGYNGQPITIERLRRFMDGYSTRVFVVKGKEKLMTWRDGGDLERIQDSIRDREEQLEVHELFEALNLRETE